MSRRVSIRLRARAEAFKQDQLSVRRQLDAFDGNDYERQRLNDALNAYKIVNVELNNLADELGREGL